MHCINFGPLRRPRFLELFAKSRPLLVQGDCKTSFELRLQRSVESFVDHSPLLLKFVCVSSSPILISNSTTWSINAP